MLDNWLAKLASEQPVNEDSMAQAIEDISPEDLQEIAATETLTPNLDSFQQKIAEADIMGRELAHEQGLGLAAQAEDRALQNHAVSKAIAELPDDEAVKLAYVLENGTEQEKVAFLGAIKGLAAKALRSGAGRKAMNLAVKHPTAAMGIGGAAAGGVAAKATGGSFTRGAVGGAALGAGAGHLMGGGQVRRGVGKASRWARNMQKVAHLSAQATKVAQEANSWLAQFEGTPMLQQALDLSQRELQLDMQAIEERSNSASNSWLDRDKVGNQKRLLELQLIAQRNGLSEPDGDELGGPATTADHPEPDADDQEAGEGLQHEQQETPMEEAQEQVKQAYARALLKVAKFKLPLPIAGPRVTSMMKGKAKDLTHLIGKRPPPIPGSMSRKLPGVAKMANRRSVTLPLI